MSKNDTLDKIDEAIKKIQGEEFSDVKVDKEDVYAKDDTDTKIFNENVSSNLEITREFNGVVEETKKLQEDRDVKVSEEVSKKSNIGIYIGYFISLIIVVVLIVAFILFLYN